MIFELLEKCYPDEIEFAEPAMVEGIIDNINFENTETSSNIAMNEIVITLSGGVVAIKALLDIYTFVKQKGNKNPTSSVIINEINIKHPEISRNKDINELTEALIEHYLNKNSSDK